MTSNDAKAVIALTTRLGSSQRPSLTAKGWHRLHGLLLDSGHTPASLFDPSVDVAELPGVEPATAENVGVLLSDAASTALEAEALERRGIWITTIVDSNYPSALAARLKDAAPPVIFGVGGPSLLSRPGVGIVGSREIGDAGARVAQDLAAVAVSLGRTVVSGGARGIDQLAMNAAYQARGGAVIGVLADSLITRIRNPDILTALDNGRTCLLTEQAPASGFSPGAAMSRNKMIYALSDLTVVVCSDLESGGTWSGAVEALRKDYGPVAVWRGEGEGPGNAELERRGAIPIEDVSSLDSILRRRPNPPTGQLSLIED